MKKLLGLLFAISVLFCSAQHTGSRYGVIPEGGGPYQVPNKVIFKPAYAPTINLTTTHEETIVQVGTLTASCAITSSVTNCYYGDKLYMQFYANNSSQTVSFGSNILASGNLTVAANASASLIFMFDGTNWSEVTRKTGTSPVTQRTATTFTATGSITLTAVQVNLGLIVAATSTVATTFTLPSATALGTQLNAAAGTTFDFIVSNSGASNGTVTVAVGSGITASGFPGTNTLTLAGSATVGIATFRLTFISATVATITRIS